MKRTDSVFIDTLSDKTIGVYIGAGNLVGTAKTLLNCTNNQEEIK